MNEIGQSNTWKNTGNTHTHTLDIWENANKSKIIVQSGLSTFLMVNFRTCIALQAADTSIGIGRCVQSCVLCAVCISLLENKTYKMRPAKKDQQQQQHWTLHCDFLHTWFRRPSVFCIICFKFYGWVTAHIPLICSIKHFAMNDVEVISIRVVHGFPYYSFVISG